MSAPTALIRLLLATLWASLADGCSENGAELVIFVSPFPAAASSTQSSKHCGSSPKEPCSSIRSAIAAIPADLSSDVRPVIHLLPGVYRGADNVGLGDPATTAFPSDSVRGIEIRGGGLSTEDLGGETAQISPLLKLKLSEPLDLQLASRGLSSFKERSWGALRWLLPESVSNALRGARAAPAAEVAYASVSAVIDCAGASNVTRGLYLMSGRITTLMNISVVNCGGGGLLISDNMKAVASSSSSSTGVASAKTGGSRASSNSMSSNGGGQVGCGSSASISSSHESSSLATTVLLHGVTVEKCGRPRVSGGGGIFVTEGASVLLENCELQGNEAKDGGGLHVAAGCNVTVSGGIFGENLAERGGAAVAGEGSWLTFRGGTVVRGNTAAAAGGGLWSHGATLRADDLQVLQNVAAGEGVGCKDEGGCGGRGGGIGASGGSVFLRGGSISGNRADAQKDRDDYARGGGIYARGVSFLSTGVVFEGNRAGAVAGAGSGGAAGAGGGAYFDSSIAEFAGGAIRNNEAAASSLLAQLGAYGGGVLVRGREGSMTLSGVTFNANTARNGGGGGALWVGDGAQADLSSCSFTDNRALSSYQHHGVGGAMAASSTSAVNITGCSFSNNLAAPEGPAAANDRAWAVAALGDKAAVAGGPQEDWEAASRAANRQCLSGEGGALLSSGAALRVSDTIFDGNRCAAGGMDTGCQGGAVSLNGRDTGSSDDDEVVLFERVVFHGNAAVGADGYGAFDGGGRGGALAAKFVDAPLFSECNFTMNYVEGGSSGGGSGGRGSGMPSTGGAVFLLCCGGASSSSAAGRGCSVRSSGGSFGSPSSFASSHEAKGRSGGNGGAPMFVGCRFHENRAGREQSENLASPDEDSLSTAARSGSSSGMGGAFSASGSAPVLRSCVFEANRAFAGASTNAAAEEAGEAPPSWRSWPRTRSMVPPPVHIPQAHLVGALADVAAADMAIAATGAIPPGLGGAIFLTPDCIGVDVSDTAFADNVAVGGSGDDLAIVGGRDTATASWARRDGMLLAAASAASSGAQLPAQDVANATAVFTDCEFVPIGAANGSSTFVFLAAAGDVVLLRPLLQGDVRAYVSDARARLENGDWEAAEVSAEVGAGSLSSHLALLGNCSSGGGGSGTGSGGYSGDGSISIVVVGAAGLTLGSGTAAPPSLRDLELHGGEVRVVSPLATTDSLVDRDEPAALTIAGYVQLYSGLVSAVTGTLSLLKAARAQAEAATETGVSLAGLEKNLAASAIALHLPGRIWLGPAHPHKAAAETVALAAAQTRAVGAARAASAAGRAAAGTSVTLDGVVLSIEGSASFSGQLTLQGAAAAVKVAMGASLQVVGDGTISGSSIRTTAAAVFEPAAAAANASMALVNEGTLQLAEGVRLAIEGGLVQTASGSLRLPLPLPPPLPPPVVPSASIKRSEAVGGGLTPQPPLVVGGAVSLEGVLNLTETRSDAGGTGAVQMHRRWAVMSFDGSSSAAAMNVSSLSIGGLPGVKLAAAVGPQQDYWWPAATGESAAAKEVEFVGSSSWALVFEAVSIECEFMLHYGNVTAAGGICQACLANSECAWCNEIIPTTATTGHEGGAGSSSGCVPVFAAKRGGHGGGSSPSLGHCQIGDCCPKGCSGTSRCDVATGRCRCGWFFVGASCGDVSTTGAAALAAGAAALLLAVAAALQARFLRPWQRLKDLHGTLRELRQGLLEVDSVVVTDRHLYGLGSDDEGATSDGGASSKDGGGSGVAGGGGAGPQQPRQRIAAGGGGTAGSGSGGGPSTPSVAGGGGSVTRDYIEELQQDLALRDVLVPFAEVTLGPRIGGGAVGAVYRATWRGAAVAVKMVHLPQSIIDAATAAQEMERLKREAYLMSRLRHPNVVLILAISFAPQPLPPSLASDNGGGIAAAGCASSSEQLTPARLRELGFLPPEKEERDATDSPEMRMRGRRLRRRSSDRRRSSGSPTAKAVAAAAGSNAAGSGGALCVISELMPGGSLEDAIARGDLDEAPYALLVGIALQAARGMLFLHTHSPPICHRDLKSSNLVVGPGWQIKITDFGMSRFVPGGYSGGTSGGDTGPSSSTSSPVRYFSFSTASGSGGGAGGGSPAAPSAAAAAAASASHAGMHMTSNVGTVAWAAPEMFGGTGSARYSLKVDSYSFGMVLWELCERRRPWGHLTSRFDIMDAVAAGKRPAISAGVPRPLSTLMRRCWQHDPAGRPNFREIVAFLQEEAEHATATAGEATASVASTLELSSGAGAGSSIRMAGSSMAGAGNNRKTRRMSE